MNASTRECGSRRGRRIPALATALTLLLAAWGCSIGGWGRDPLAAGRGGMVELTTATSSLSGELLLAEETGVLLLGERGLTRTPWGSVRSLEFVDRPVEPFGSGDAIPPVSLPSMRLASRYPYGLTEEQIDALLAHHEQASAEEVR